MRKLAMLSTALFGLAFFHQSHAQQNASPQPGLPPGASVGAPNAQPPLASGNLSTTRTAPSIAPAPAPMMTSEPAVTTPRPVRHRRVRHRVRHHHATHSAAPATPAASQ